MTTATKPRAKRKPKTICALRTPRATVKEERTAEFVMPKAKQRERDFAPIMKAPLLIPVKGQTTISGGLAQVWASIGATVLDLNLAGMRLVACEITERTETQREGDEDVEYVVREVRLGFA